MKVVCENCDSSFKWEMIKGKECCPVCGASFEDQEIENVDNGGESKANESENGLMYFDEIMIFEKKPEYNNVNAYCKECGYNNSPELDLFNKLVDKEYVILKSDVVLKCEGCGREHKPRKILYKKKDHYAPPLPRCPVCNSAMLKKIATGSKFLAAATVGMFALPYNSKTFECKDCGYRF